MAAWKRSTRIDRSCCGGIITGRFVSLLIKKYQQDKKQDSCSQIASTFAQFLNQFFRTLKTTISTRPGLLKAWLVLTSVKYHGNLYILIPLNQQLALTRLRATSTSYEILVARTKFSVALATRKAQFRTLVHVATNNKIILL